MRKPPRKLTAQRKLWASRQPDRVAQTVTLGWDQVHVVYGDNKGTLQPSPLRYRDLLTMSLTKAEQDAFVQKQPPNWANGIKIVRRDTRSPHEFTIEVLSDPRSKPHPLATYPDVGFGQWLWEARVNADVILGRLNSYQRAWAFEEHFVKALMWVAHAPPRIILNPDLLTCEENLKIVDLLTDIANNPDMNHEIRTLTHDALATQTEHIFDYMEGVVGLTQNPDYY